MNARSAIPLAVIALLLPASLALPQQADPAIQGIQGVNQKAAGISKNLDSPAVAPAAIRPTPGVQTVQGVKKVEGTEAPATTAVKASPLPRAVQAVAPASSTHAASAIRAVEGVHGIAVPKLRNLEAALRIKEDQGPANRKGQTAAAALLGTPGKERGPRQAEDSRAVFQEFAEQKSSGS